MDQPAPNAFLRIARRATHGARHERGEPQQRARHLSAARQRKHGAPLLPFPKREMGPCRVDEYGRRMGVLSAAAIRWKFVGATSGTRGCGMHFCWVVTGWPVDVLQLRSEREISHLAQHFPDGPPEQITSGVNEEEGIAVAPDGRSLITSVGSQESTVWVHDRGGDHQITSEGRAYFEEPDGVSGRQVFSSASSKIRGRFCTAWTKRRGLCLESRHRASQSVPDSPAVTGALLYCRVPGR
jgi:hypothetical protein